MKKILSTGMMLAVVFLFAEDFTVSWMQAAKLMGNNKFAEAADAYHNLAAAESGIKKKAALFQEILCLGKAKKMDQALSASEKVSDPNDRAFLRMNAYFFSQKYKNIVKEFENADIRLWPEKYAYLGWQMRGIAFSYTGNDTRALSDLKEARSNAGSDHWNQLIIESRIFFLAKKMKDRQEALKIADAIFANSEYFRNYPGSYYFLLPMVESIKMMTADKNTKEARARLDKIVSANPHKKGYYAFLLQECYGDIEFADGNTAAAKDHYEKALKEKHSYGWEECEKRIQEKRRKIEAVSVKKSVNCIVPRIKKRLPEWI